MPDGTLNLVPGAMNTTLAEEALAREQASMALNCSTERMIWEGDKRQRKFSAKPSVFSNNLSQGMVYYGNVSSSRYLAINNQKARSIESSQVSLAGTTDRFSSYDYLPDCTIETGRMVMWQHDNMVFAAGGSSGNVVVFDMAQFATTGPDPCDFLYRDYYLDTSAASVIKPPPYSEKLLFQSNDTIADDGKSNTTAYITTAGGVQYVRNSQFQSGDTTSGFRLTFNAANRPNLSRVDYLHTVITMLQSNDTWLGATGNWYQTDPLWGLRMYDGTTVYNCRVFPIMIEDSAAGNNQLSFYVDLTPIPRANRTAIQYIELECHVLIQGSLNWIMEPFTKGAVWIGKDTADTYLGDTSPAFETGSIEYAFAYYDVSLASFSQWTRIPSVPKSVVMGQPAHVASKFMGSNVRFQINPITDPPYITTDTIGLFRRKTNGDWVEITNSAHAIVGQPTRATNVADANGDNPYIVDNLQQAEVDAISTTVAPNFNSSSPAALSGKVADIVCGCSWNGANVYGSKNGRIYMSDTTDWKRTLWDGVNVGKITGDNAQPRTVKVTDDTILSVVGSNSLFVFSRTATWAFVGDVPNKALGPVKLENSKGTLGSYAATVYGDGALVATDDGLYYIELPPDYAGMSGQVVVQELTADNRGVWQTLIGTTESDRNKTVVTHHAGHLWVFCEDRYMHRWPSGKWVYGVWADSLDVWQAATHPFYGLVLMSVNGDMRVVGDFATDGGTSTDGTGGTAFEWEHSTGKMFLDHVVRRFVVRSNEQSGLEIDYECEMYDKFSMDNPYTLDVGGSEKQDVGVPKPSGGRWSKVTLRGTGANKVYKVDAKITLASTKEAR